MALWSKKKIDERLESPNSDALRTRARKYSQEELVDGAETLLNNLVYFIPEYRRSKNGDMLAEIKLTAESLYVLAEALLERTDDPIAHPAPQAQRARQVRSF